MAFELPKLGYDYEDLEPYIDMETMETHYSKHHAGYVKKLNAAVEKTELEGKEIEEILKNIDELPDEKRDAIINNGGGHANHSMFWQIMTPDVDKRECVGEVAEAIKKKFGSFDGFKEKLIDAAMKRFGSGWAWLVVDENNELHIVTTENQDSPYSDNLTPILGVDVWEHAYYLKYKNQRDKYLEAWFEVVNWEKINENFVNALK